MYKNPHQELLDANRVKLEEYRSQYLAGKQMRDKSPVIQIHKLREIVIKDHIDTWRSKKIGSLNDVYQLTLDVDTVLDMSGSLFTRAIFSGLINMLGMGTEKRLLFKMTGWDDKHILDKYIDICEKVKGSSVNISISEMDDSIQKVDMVVINSSSITVNKELVMNMRSMSSKRVCIYGNTGLLSNLMKELTEDAGVRMRIKGDKQSGSNALLIVE